MTSKKYYGHHPLTDDERDSRRQNVVETIKLTVSEEWAGSRIDLFLSDRLEKTRSSVQRLVTQGNVSVDGVINGKPSAKVFPGQEVAVDIPEPEFLSIVPEPVDFHVVYKDEHIIVVDKSAGVVVHPAPGHWSGTLVHG
ncbi:MAG: S4 domain-containing protein, partial [Synergistota bacterium]|nr:S4 domain-containing protein [Synergistota bacterium]